MTRIIKNTKRRFTLEPLHGDCLEKIGVRIPHNGYAIVDAATNVRVGDLVVCTRTAGALTCYCKRVKSIKDDSIIVETAYLDPSRDFEFEAAEILGVVKEIYDRVFGTRCYFRRQKNAERTDR